MRLTPREVERLLLFQAAELARRRRGRGLRLNQAEATAVIADEVCEAARDGCSYHAVTARGYEVLAPGDVLDGVAALVPRIEVEALFGDGSRLIVLHDPIGRSEPPPAVPPEPALVWLAGAVGPFAARNAGDVPIGLTSHIHLFELNRRLELDRRAVYGLRPALEAGAKVVIEPGTTVDLFGVPIAGLRVVRGHGGLVDGALDEPGARERALELARERGYLGA
ncbi:MAG: urease subunit gamma/beta [Baekduia sp.]|jgi:urease subunit gamma/beta|nr:urease subunit gamma/beta [Baekduia sp.]